MEDLLDIVGKKNIVDKMEELLNSGDARHIVVKFCQMSFLL